MPATSAVASTETLAPPTTSAPTTLATTSTTTISTIDPTAEIEAAVKQAILDLEVAYFAAASDPANEELRVAYASFYERDSFEQAASFLDQLVADGTRLRASNTVAKSTTFPSPIQVTSRVEATIEVCQVDSDVIHIPASATSPEVVVDDRVLTTLSRSQLKKDDGRWILTGGERIGQWIGETRCEQ